MLEIKHLSKSFNNNAVLKDINLSVKTGTVTSLIGPSGTGKSTLLRCINLLENPESGSISIGDFHADLTKLNRKEKLALRRHSAMVFQQFNLFKNKTALENVMEALIVVKKIPKKEAREIARERLAGVGLAGKEAHYPRHLSGGQQQRVAIARSLALKPDILLLDEPTSALDPELVGEVLDTILKTAREGWTMLLVSHEMNFVRSASDRVLFLEGGSIIEDGSPEEIFSHPKSPRALAFITKINRLHEPDFTI